MGLKERFQEAYRESQAREAAMAKNPSLAETPEAKKKIRQTGAIVFILGIAVAIGDWIGWEVVGGALNIMLAIPIVLIPSGAFMMITGKNPFRKK